MELRGYSLWTKNCGLEEQEAAHAAHKASPIYVSGRDDPQMEARERLIRSLRKSTRVGVLGLHCLATDKQDLRWALIGEDAEKRYKGIFVRKAIVFVYELEAEISDMQTIEAVLRATEWWARERAKRPLAVDREIGRKGGRARKPRMPTEEAKKIWHRPGTEHERLDEINRLSVEQGFQIYSRTAAYKYLDSRYELRAKPDES